MVSINDVKINKWFKDQWGNYYARDKQGQIYMYSPGSVSGIGVLPALIPIAVKAAPFVISLVGKLKGIGSRKKDRQAFLDARDKMWDELADLASQYHGMSRSELTKQYETWKNPYTSRDRNVVNFYNDWLACMRSFGGWEFHSAKVNFPDMFNKLETVAIPCQVNKWFKDTGANVSTPSQGRAPTQQTFPTQRQQGTIAQQQQQQFLQTGAKAGGFLGMDNTTLLLLGGGIAAATLAAVSSGGKKKRRR